ncbi:hypothetical protein PV326_000959, partial [Microctonus aethiopoides]
MPDRRFSKKVPRIKPRMQVTFSVISIMKKFAPERSRWILEQMAMCFLKPNALDNIRVDSVIPDNILPLLSINVEDECQNFLNSCQSEIGGKQFAKINGLVLILLHSNAEAERAFSNVTDIIAKKRDRIGSDTVAAV